MNLVVLHSTSRLVFEISKSLVSRPLVVWWVKVCEESVCVCGGGELCEGCNLFCTNLIIYFASMVLLWYCVNVQVVVWVCHGGAKVVVCAKVMVVCRCVMGVMV